MPLRVIYWANNQSLFSSRHYEALLDAPCDIVGAVNVPQSHQASTNPLPAGSLDFVKAAWEKGIPVFSPSDPASPQFIDELGRLSPDLFLAVGYSMILKPGVLAIPKNAAVNFHASLLPQYRGKHPVFWTLRNEERWAGLTVHHLDPGIDTGDIVYQVRLRTHWNDTVASLYSRIMDQSTKLIGQLIADARKGHLPRRPQPPGEGSYFSSVHDSDFEINWNWRAKKIRRYILMTPGKCFTIAAGRRLYLSTASVAQKPSAAQPGTLLSFGRQRCLIAAGDGALWISRGSIEGRQEESLAATCRKLGIAAGTVLG